MFLLENRFTALEFNVVTKNCYDSSELSSPGCFTQCQNKWSVVWKGKQRKRERKKQTKTKNERVCLPAWQISDRCHLGADSGPLCLCKSQPDCGASCGLVNPWKPFKVQVALIRYLSQNHTCLGYALLRGVSSTGVTILFWILQLLSGHRLKVPPVTQGNYCMRSPDRTWLVPWQWEVQMTGCWRDHRLWQGLILKASPHMLAQGHSHLLAL